LVSNCSQLIVPADKHDLIDINDKLWSAIVKKRDGFKCCLCGSTKELDAHHSYKTKGSAPSLRWDSRNGMTVCRSCHQLIHGCSDTDFQQKVLAAIYTFITPEIEEDLQLKANQFFKINYAHLEEINLALNKELTILSEQDTEQLELAFIFEKF